MFRGSPEWSLCNTCRHYLKTLSSILECTNLLNLICDFTKGTTDVDTYYWGELKMN